MTFNGAQPVKVGVPGSECSGAGFGPLTLYAWVSGWFWHVRLQANQNQVPNQTKAGYSDITLLQCNVHKVICHLYTLFLATLHKPLFLNKIINISVGIS